MTDTCPACGYPALSEPPRSPTSGGGSYEICPSCGFEFGVTDGDRGLSYKQWRQRWIERGMPWDSAAIEPRPDGWDPLTQLQHLKESQLMTSSSHSSCPVCGYSELTEPPWQDGVGSDEICPSCGTHFGYDDVAGGDPAVRLLEHQRLRERWLSQGCRWSSSSRHQPSDWDPEQQFRALRGHE